MSNVFVLEKSFETVERMKCLQRAVLQKIIDVKYSKDRGDQRQRWNCTSIVGVDSSVPSAWFCKTACCLSNFNKESGFIPTPSDIMTFQTSMPLLHDTENGGAFLIVGYIDLDLDVRSSYVSFVW